MVGGQRPPLPQGSVSVSASPYYRLSLTHRKTERQKQYKLNSEKGCGGSGRGIGDCERERERERERRGRESDRESESQGEGGKKDESLYLMVGGQRANTSPEASWRAKVTLSVLLSLYPSLYASLFLALSLFQFRPAGDERFYYGRSIPYGWRPEDVVFVSSLPAFLNL